MARAREILASVVLLSGAGLMMWGQQLWRYAAGAPVGHDALFVAVASGDVMATRRALAGGASIERCSDLGLTPLALAASGGDQNLVAFLIAHGAQVDALTSHGCTALTHVAIVNGDVGVIRALLDAGADPNGSAASKLPPLVGAVATGHEDAVDVLLESGADPNLWRRVGNGASPLTALSFADEPSKPLARQLIAAGADVNRPDGDGTTPLRAALNAGHTELAALLRRAGATADRTVRATSASGPDRPFLP